MTNPNDLNALDLVNPYLSVRRQWICTQLIKLVPNEIVIVASNDPRTNIRFQEWTGQSQTSLERAWQREGFRRAKTREERARGVWIRNGGGAVTTSCEGLIGKVLAKLTTAGYGPKPNASKVKATSFNLSGCDKYGREPATVTGWHWFRDRSETVHPQAGDLFQVGVLAKPGQWSFRHVGIITGYVDGAIPSWETVEAGQGGPAIGFDFLKRKKWRSVISIDPKNPKKELMGWLNIDEYLGE